VEPLKNVFDPSFVTRLADAVAERDAGFKRKVFLVNVLDRAWSGRELKDRMHHLAFCLNESMSGSYPDKINLLIEISPDFKGLAALVFPDFVEMFGLDDWDISIHALEMFTPLSSSEFAVRPFIIRDPVRMMATMNAWAGHENEHVRRLASEGCRPRLPWAMALPGFKRDPKPVIPVLERLRDDPSEYVRRSVANNLNDIAKDHPDLVLKIAKAWLKNAPESRRRLVKHACRTLLKRGDPRAMKLFGYDHQVNAKVADLRVKKSKVSIGQSIEFSFRVGVPEGRPASLRIEYAIDYVKARGGHGRKVFKITERMFSGEERISRKHKVQDLTTRIHYPGRHHLHIIVNGRKINTATFYLVRRTD